MAGELKQAFIEAVRLTPEGIAGFLTTGIPAAPSIATPSDVDAAIIANGICAKYILDLLAPFAGLTPIELLLRIGQHNNVLEAAMIAGLAYIEGADAGENAITIVEPQDGVSYSPGEIRFLVKANNGVCTEMSLSLGESPIDMKDVSGTWQQYVNLAIGEYTATFEAIFEDNSTATASCSFTIADYDPQNPPDPLPDPVPQLPGGTNQSAIDKALSDFDAAYQHFGDLISYQVGVDELYASFNSLSSKAWSVAVIVKAKNPPGYTDLALSLADELDALEGVIGDLNYELIVSGLATIPTIVHRIAGLY